MRSISNIYGIKLVDENVRIQKLIVDCAVKLSNNANVDNGIVSYSCPYMKLTSPNLYSMFSKLKSRPLIDYKPELVPKSENPIHTSRNKRQSISPSMRNKIKKDCDYTCQLCGKKIPDDKNLHIDHKIPFAISHDNNASNLQILCSVCNQQKGDKIYGRYLTFINKENKTEYEEMILAAYNAQEIKYW